MTALCEVTALKRDALCEAIARYGSSVIAFSGGVDSAVVAQAAGLALGDSAVAVTGDSAALAAGELAAAGALAQRIGIRHLVVRTGELANSSYTANAPDRCYHCKTELYTRLRAVADELGLAVLANGANADDLGDFRPGMQAAREHGVRSPLAECGLTKADVRQLAAAWELPVADKPATPCLSSRIAYGQQVSPDRLRRIDEAEQFLRARGFRELRVRYHGDELARIEVPSGELTALCEPQTRAAIIEEFTRLGFKFVTLDLAGFRSGSLLTLVPAELLQRDNWQRKE
jgi:uncharacterized protein